MTSRPLSNGTSHSAQGSAKSSWWPSGNGSRPYARFLKRAPLSTVTCDVRSYRDSRTSSSMSSGRRAFPFWRSCTMRVTRPFGHGGSAVLANSRWNGRAASATAGQGADLPRDLRTICYLKVGSAPPAQAWSARARRRKPRGREPAYLLSSFRTRKGRDFRVLPSRSHRSASSRAVVRGPPASIDAVSCDRWPSTASPSTSRRKSCASAPPEKGMVHARAGQPAPVRASGRQSAPVLGADRGARRALLEGDHA